MQAYSPDDDFINPNNARSELLEPSMIPGTPINITNEQPMTSRIEGHDKPREGQIRLPKHKIESNPQQESVPNLEIVVPTPKEVQAENVEKVCDCSIWHIFSSTTSMEF